MTHAVRSPYDRRVVGTVQTSTLQDVADACAVAASQLGQGLAQHERAEILERTVGALRDQRERFAELICGEAGKPIAAARAEVDRAVETCVLSAVEARRLAGHVVPMEASAAGRGRIGFTIAEPIGVVAAIAPFNFPLNLVAHKLGPAIAAGCPVVLKPAEATSLTAIALVDLLVVSGLPVG